MYMYIQMYLWYDSVPSLYVIQEYGGLENAPGEIKATMVEMEQLTMSEAGLA